MAATGSVETTRPVAAKQGRSHRAPVFTPYLFLAVPVIMFLIWVIGPMFYSFYLSLTNWDGITSPEIIGFANYQRLFKDPLFYTSIGNNVKWLVSFITVPVALGLALALALNRNLPGARGVKSAIYSPYILAPVIIGLIFGWIYLPVQGLLNTFLRTVGLGALQQGWLANPALATWCIIAAAIWRQVGYIMVLYLAGLQGVDPTLIDAAKVDGANGWQQFRNVIWPLLAPVTIIVVVISIIDSLRSFDLVYIMTRGGPANSSSVMATFMYIEAFNNYKMGYGATIAVVLFLLTSIFIFIYLWRVMQDELEY